jgi:hypothetical protein
MQRSKDKRHRILATQVGRKAAARGRKEAEKDGTLEDELELNAVIDPSPSLSRCEENRVEPHSEGEN